MTGPMNGCGSANGSSTISRSISFCDRVDQRPLLPVLDDQPPRRGAALAGGQISGLDGHRRRGVDVLRVPDDERIVAAQLEREDLLRGLGELPVKRHAGAGRAGEQQAVDARLAGERATLVGTADQQADDAFGNARLVEAVDQELAGRRGLLRRLEDHRVAGDQRRDDVAVGKVRREIVRPEHREHAVRLVADRDAVAQRRLQLPLRRPLGIGVDRDLDLVDDRARPRSALPTTACRSRARSARRTRSRACATTLAKRRSASIR